MKAVPTAVLTLWMPALFLVGLWLSLSGLQPQYWIIFIPIVPLLAYMNTLAAIHNSGAHIRIKRWWGSLYVAESEILDISPSVLQGIGRLRLRRFVPPWGVIYFVADWSSFQVPHTLGGLGGARPSAAPRKRFPELIASVLMAASGFILGRMFSRDFHALVVNAASEAALALAISGSLAVLFVLTRKRMPSLANLLLFLAALVVGLVRELHAW